MSYYLIEGGGEVEIRIKVAAVCWRSASLTGVSFIKSSSVAGMNGPGEIWKVSNGWAAERRCLFQGWGILIWLLWSSQIKSLDDIHSVMKVNLSIYRKSKQLIACGCCEGGQENNTSGFRHPRNIWRSAGWRWLRGHCSSSLSLPMMPSCPSRSSLLWGKIWKETIKQD